MCGIAGLLSTGSDDADDISATLQKMTRSLAYRGPDAEGFWREGEVALGHRRLSILDLSNAGAQPMRSKVDVTSSSSMAKSTTASICVVTSQ